MRSARRRCSASQTVSGPVVSPGVRHRVQAGGDRPVEVRLELRALGTPISGPPSPNETSPSGRSRSSVARRTVSSADSSPASPGMSKHQRSTVPNSASADLRASSIASMKARSSMPRRVEENGVTVSSAYRICCRAMSRAISYVSSRTSSGVRIRSTTDRYTSMKCAKSVNVKKSARASGSVGTLESGWRAASSATIRGEAEPTWWTCSSALGSPAMKACGSRTPAAARWWWSVKGSSPGTAPRTVRRSAGRGDRLIDDSGIIVGRARRGTPVDSARGRAGTREVPRRPVIAGRSMTERTNEGTPRMSDAAQPPHPPENIPAEGASSEGAATAESAGEGPANGTPARVPLDKPPAGSAARGRQRMPNPSSIPGRRRRRTPLARVPPPTAPAARCSGATATPLRHPPPSTTTPRSPRRRVPTPPPGAHSGHPRPRTPGLGRTPSPHPVVLRPGPRRTTPSRLPLRTPPTPGPPRPASRFPRRP